MTTRISRLPGRMPGWARAVTALVLVLAVLFAGLRQSVVQGLKDLFGTDTHDRSGPALLRSGQDISRCEAACGSFQVVVDPEKGARFLPDAIRGTRTLYVCAGTVDAHVDLGRVAEGDVTVDEDRTSATLRLPHAALGAPALAPERSYAVSERRGLPDRIGDLFSGNPGGEQAVQKLAARRIREAAEESEPTARRAQHHRQLRGLLHPLGFTEVRVTYGG
ncbi:DUF4230 domain-containing protein [Streptomyces poriticola]|uniref:DUF4230 domain-containing protein n=1 Tax=Streptomyces poriticola TaxID=3120506 RepID=UPI002FCDFA68